MEWERIKQHKEKGEQQKHLALDLRPDQLM